MARSKRGRLSSIDLLPDEATPHIRDAIEHLKERKRSQEEIREELNTHLLALGADPVSRSAFNRKSLQIAAYGQHLIQAREIAAIMAEKLGEAPEGDIGILLNETIKTLVYDVVMEQSLSEDSASVEMLKQASLALMRLERAREISVDARAKMVSKFKADGAAALDEAVDRGAIDTAAAQKAREIMGFVS